MLGPIDESEPLTRYVFSKRHFNTSGVRAAAFLPAPDGDTSVFRTKELPAEDIWAIGRFVEEQKGQTLRARADVLVRVVTEQELSVEIETTPHPRHANISNWPPDKDAQLMKAVELANASTMHRLQ